MSVGRTPAFLAAACGPNCPRCLIRSAMPVFGAPAAWRLHPEYGWLRATGADRVRFLNGMLSADVGRLREWGVVSALQFITTSRLTKPTSESAQSGSQPCRNIPLDGSPETAAHASLLPCAVIRITGRYG